MLIPRLTVFYDGAIPESEMYDAIEAQLKEYVMNIEFDAAVYVSRLMDAIRKAEHITDVYVDEAAHPSKVYLSLATTRTEISSLCSVCTV